MSKFSDHSWGGNRITDRQMARMVKIRKKTKKPLNIIVREALDEYLKRRPKQRNSDLYLLRALKPIVSRN